MCGVNAVAALQAADLVTALQGAGPFTVVAPTNAAFEALPLGVLTWLLPVKFDDVQPARFQFEDLLRYHIVPGVAIKAGDFKDHSQLVSRQGDAIDVFVPGPYAQTRIYVNNANVSSTNIFASNGIIHKIDSVLVRRDFTFGRIGANATAQAQSLPCLSTFGALQSSLAR